MSESCPLLSEKDKSSILGKSASIELQDGGFLTSVIGILVSVRPVFKKGQGTPTKIILGLKNVFRAKRTIG